MRDKFKRFYPSMRDFCIITKALSKKIQKEI